MLAGKGLADEISLILNPVLVVGVVNSIVIVFIGLFIVWIMNLEYIRITEYMLFSGVLLVNVVFNIIDASLRAEMRFIDFAGMIFMRALLLVGLGFVLAIHFGLTGVLVAEALAGAVAVIYGTRSMSFNSKFLPGGFGIDTVGALLLKGRVFLGLQTSRYFSLTADKWIIGWFAGAVVLGHYSFVLITFMGFMAVAGLFNSVIIPRMIARFGGNGDVFMLRRDIVRLCVAFLVVAILGAPLYLAFAEFAIDRYYGLYAFDGMVLALAFIYFGSVLHVVHHFFDSYFYALSKQRELSIISVLGLLSFLILFLLAAVYESSVVYFSLAFMLAKALLLLITSYNFSRCKAVPAALVGSRQ